MGTITVKGKYFLPFRINRLVKKSKELPDKLVMTEEQLCILMRTKHLEIVVGNDVFPTEYLYYTKYNAMEVTIDNKINFTL